MRQDVHVRQVSRVILTCTACLMKVKINATDLSLNDHFFLLFAFKEPNRTCEYDYECTSQEYCSDKKCANSCLQCRESANCLSVKNHRAHCECPPGGCKDKCKEGTCGINADCEPNLFTSVCSCPSGTSGNPFEECHKYQDNLCDPNPCEPNSVCKQIDGFGRHVECNCLPGYTKNTNYLCSKDRCDSDEECADDQACRNQTCTNPCEGSCGKKAICQTKGHKPACACPPGSAGNALTVCHERFD